MKNNLKYLIIVILVIAFWQYFGSTDSTVRLYISSPTLIADYFSGNYMALARATVTTLVEALAGLTIATFISFVVMVACFHKPELLSFIIPTMVVSQVIPTIVLAPFFVLIFGIGITSKIAMAAVITFFPVFVNFVHGYKSIPQNIHELMKVYRAPISFRIRNVYFPLSASSIVAGLKISTTLAIIGAIVAEFTGARAGIGKNLFVSAIRLEPDLMMSSLILATLMGLGMYGAVRLLEKRIVVGN